MNKNNLKSIGALFAGFISISILSVGTDILLESIGILPAQTEPSLFVWWMLLFALIYRTIYGVVGGYFTAVLAPSRPMRHVVIFGTIGFIFGIIGAILNWKNAISLTHWYTISLIILTLPSILLGGKLASNTKKEQ